MAQTDQGLVGIYVIIMISGFSIACATLKLKALLEFRTSIDIIWTLASAHFLSLVEICVAFITSSVLVIYPLFVKQQASSKNSKGLANQKSSNSQPEIRYHKQNVSGSGMPSPKTYEGWKFERSKGADSEVEMDVFEPGALTTLHEIPSTRNLHEPGNSSGKSHDQIEVRWKSMSE